MSEDVLQLIMDAALDQGQPIAFANRAFHLARRIAEVGRARWVVENGVLPDPSVIEPLFAAYSSLQIAATDEYLKESEWEGVVGAPSRSQTLRHLLSCFKHAQWNVETMLISVRPSASLVDVNAELVMLIERLEALWKEA
jgi:hypothetical protein